MGSEATEITFLEFNKTRCISQATHLNGYRRMRENAYSLSLCDISILRIQDDPDNSSCDNNGTWLG